MGAGGGSSGRLVVVASGAGWVLQWPVERWAILTPEERADVVATQQRLMAEASDGNPRLFTNDNYAPAGVKHGTP